MHDSYGEVNNRGIIPKRIDNGFFSCIPPELYPHILKFLSSEVILLNFYFIFIFFVFMVLR